MYSQKKYFYIFLVNFSQDIFYFTKQSAEQKTILQSCFANISHEPVLRRHSDHIVDFSLSDNVVGFVQPAQASSPQHWLQVLVGLQLWSKQSSDFVCLVICFNCCSTTNFIYLYSYIRTSDTRIETRPSNVKFIYTTYTFYMSRLLNVKLTIYLTLFDMMTKNNVSQRVNAH